ncbi:MAG: [FeFe] hydrogenase H-cluster radical SAM maturase HydE [Candidatus Micrarchaeota archaeon]
MCYAIPGKIISISKDGKTATIQYFDELRNAHIIGAAVSIGDYVYAQGGIVVGKISEAEALPILKLWKTKFLELKKVDEELASIPENISSLLQKAEAGDEEPLTKEEMRDVLNIKDETELNSLYQTANHIRKKRLDNACCVHGIIEFSNYCMQNCLYCGIRCDNKKITRYRMSEEEILQAVDYAVDRLGFKALVLQSGEDSYYTDEMLISIVKKIREKHGILIFMSIGERSKECYIKLYGAGAYGVLIRFETSNSKLYARLRPGKKLDDRLELIRWLKSNGFVVATGFLIGLPGQTKEDIVNDVLLTKSIVPDMYSFGPFIPHQETPLFAAPSSQIAEVLKVIALSRFVDQESKILVTTALETFSHDAKKAGLLAGANSLMINLTPEKYRKHYDLYPGKTGLETENWKPNKEIRETIKLLESLGRAPTDLGV